MRRVAWRHNGLNGKYDMLIYGTFIRMECTTRRKVIQTEWNRSAHIQISVLFVFLLSFRFFLLMCVCFRE